MRQIPRQGGPEQTAEQNPKGLEAMGFLTVKAHVRSNEFADWCRATGRDIDAHALTA